ncbi:MAG: PD-(D/E)XK motif protein [Clostridia bacterium]|nr:PD-(D/E)XK motif protein [Clostridia bacterium]
MDIREQFTEFTRPGYFSRVDSTHILDLHIGLDEKGRKAIELRFNCDPVKVTGTSAIDVSQYKKKEYNTIRFSLKDDDMSGLFYKFCDDIIEQTADLKKEKDGYKAITNRFFQWKKMFVLSKNTFLTEPEIMGLIGEILFLRGYLADKYGISVALKSWSGQELTHKDFSYKDIWYEVKAISRGKNEVRISSLEQLDSETDGELVIFSMEKMSPAYNGVSLNKIIIETVKLFSSSEEKDAFLSKVALQGYEYNDYYDNFVFEISNMVRYKVTDGFPRLVANDVPVAIVKANYDISLSEIMPYIIREED